MKIHSNVLVFRPQLLPMALLHSHRVNINLLHLFSKWSFQVGFLSRKTPRYLACLKVSSRCPLSFNVLVVLHFNAPRSWMEFTPSSLPFYCKKKKQFFKYNLGKFLKYITFSSYSLIIFESLPKLYLKNWFFQLNVKMEGVNFIPDLEALRPLVPPGKNDHISLTRMQNLCKVVGFIEGRAAIFA